MMFRLDDSTRSATQDRTSTPAGSAPPGERSYMWNAAIAGADAPLAASLRACLQQTGMISSVAQWDLGAGVGKLDQMAAGVNVVVLCLNGNPGPALSFAADLRRTYPTVRIIAHTQDRHPDSQLLMAAMRSGVQEFLPAPLTAIGVQEALTRFQGESDATRIESPQKLIIVMGSKGGVGSSSIAVNLAVQLVQMTERRVVLLDFARPIGHAALMLDLQSRYSLRDATESIDRLDSHFFAGLLSRHKSGLEVLPGISHPEEWHQIPNHALPNIVNVAQSGFDYVVMDYGSIFTLAWLSEAVLRLARTTLLVAEANVPALWTLERHMAGLTAVGFNSNQIRVVINRWTRGDDEAIRSLEKKLKRPVFARIPNDFRQVSESVNLGMPLHTDQGNPLVSQIQKLIVELGINPAAQAAPPKREPLGGIFSVLGRRK